MSKFDSLAIVEQMPSNSRVRLVGVDWKMNNVEDIYTLYDKLDTFRGLDENSNTVDDVVVTGKIYVPELTATDVDVLSARYPSITFTYGAIKTSVRFISDGVVISHLRLSPGSSITVPSNPTKESTAQYTYKFTGWSTDGETVVVPAYTVGEVDLTYYAVFESNIRSYTVRFLNDNGAVLQSTNMVYGSLPVYTKGEPQSTQEGGWKFANWYPEITTVTGNVDYTAQYVAKKALDSYSWSEISAMSADGTAANYCDIGECKAITLNGTVGTLELNNLTVYVYILGFNHNSEVEGNGITFGTFKTAPKDGKDFCLVDSKYNSDSVNGTKYFSMNHWGHSSYGGWAGCDIRYDILGSTDNAPSDYGAKATSGRVGYDPSATCATSPVANTLMAALPSDLRAVMKPMTKYTDNTGASGDTEEKVTVTIDYLPLLAEFEIFGTRKNANSYEQNKQKQYDYFVAGNSKKKYQHSAISSTAVWWERSASSNNSAYFCTVTTSGSASNHYSAYALGIAPIFKV